MAQIQLESGAEVYLLPYPVTFKEVMVPRAAEFTAYAGVVSRDYPAGRAPFPRLIFIGWEELTEAEMITINTAWQAMARDMAATWTFTTPDDDDVTYDAWLNPENFNLQSQRYAGGYGTVLYTARLSLLVE
jgi:hypothetical protein